VHFHDILSAWEGTWFASSRWQTSWLGLLGILIGIPTWSYHGFIGLAMVN
jgi:hypothetical protein